MKKLKVLVAMVLMVLMGACSALTDMVLQDTAARTSQNENDSGSDVGNGNTAEKGSDDKSVILPPQMVGMMFGVFYHIYFSWGGLYNHESLKAGQWAKYEFSETGKKQETVFITKACLSKNKAGMNYLLKIENKKDWMKLNFAIDAALKLSSLRYSSSQGANQEIQNVSFAVEAQNFNYQFPFATMPKKTVETSAGKQLTYEYKLGQDKEQYALYLNPKVPGYLVLWEARNQKKQSRMQLVAYGKNAAVEVR